MFWAFTTTLSDRALRGIPVDARLDDEFPGPVAVAPTRAPATLAFAAAPNPARGACCFRLTLEAPGEVAIDVFDVTGRRVRSLRPGWRDAGVSEVRWNGRDDAGAPVAAGVYLARVGRGARRAEARVALVR
jgi:hypothetical protein